MPELKIPHNGNAGSELITYHDSCYLGRYNQLYQAPRQLLDHANNARIELKRSKQNSFCCGGGGGQMWLETDADTRINHHRLADVQNSGAKTVATACPYCLLMFDDAIRSKGLGDQIQVLDIAEILDQRLNG
jgi:Fe-S oxidoreductase